MKKVLLYICTAAICASAYGQGQGGPLSLKECLDHSLQYNETIRKDKLGAQAARESVREVVGSLLPQINGSAGLTYNIDKTTIAMPNFVNSMMPEQMRDPNAAKYMTVTMGMDLSANWGFQLSQQLVNFSLFNAVKIAKTSEEMANLGVQSEIENVIAKTATLYYYVQILNYSLGLFDRSLDVMKDMSEVMEANRSIGLVRNVDADRIKVASINLETEKLSLTQARDIQLNLLKLQMGFPMEESIEVAPADMEALEKMVFTEPSATFEVESQMPFKMFKKQQTMLDLQRKSAISETLPMLSLSANYSTNYMGDHFYGETYHHFPVSMVGVNFRIPIFSGLSKSAKVKRMEIEFNKSLNDEKILSESLTMGYRNARMQMDTNRSTIISQKRNMELAEDVQRVTESNYREGIANLSDFLNSTSSMIQAQANYVTAVGNCISAYIDLKKANGTIMDINE